MTYLNKEALLEKLDSWISAQSTKENVSSVNKRYHDAEFYKIFGEAFQHVANEIRTDKFDIEQEPTEDKESDSVVRIGDVREIGRGGLLTIIKVRDNYNAECVYDNMDTDSRADFSDCKLLHRSKTWVDGIEWMMDKAKES